ncbi:MAG: phage Gp37/Gp68 family protein [Candidatus Aminicenantales bacterium]
MAQLSSIEWTEATWNPVTGCSKLSPGCKNCYADRMARRLKAMGNIRYKNGFGLALHHDLLGEPLRWKTPRMIFVNSMSDLFHPKIPTRFIIEVFKVMNIAWWHIFQILTKRSERLAELSEKLNWSKNIWIGTSVENSDYIYRIDHLKKVNAHIRFISVEPMLGPIHHLSVSGIDWVIVGGESGPRAREIKPEWVRFIRDNCLKNEIPFFFKQWGGKQKWKSGRILDGKVWNEVPKKGFFINSKFLKSS